MEYCEEELKKIESEHLEKIIFGDISGSWNIPQRKKRLILSARFRRLAVDAFRKKKISDEKLSKLLNTDRNSILSTIKETT